MFFLSAAPLSPPSDEPVPGWRYGPIRYILTVDEDRRYKGSHTDDERREFIQRFWAALDPTPATEINERRLEFWRRVEQANDLFHEPTGPGWTTDRGKAYILLGPPDKRSANGPAEVWVYTAIPGSHEPPEMRVGFQRNGSGEYHFVRGSLRYLDPLAEPGGAPAGDTYLSVKPKGSSSQLLKERIRMYEFPSGHVTTQEFIGPIESARQYGFYRANDGTTYSELALKIRASQLDDSDLGASDAPLNFSVTVEDAKTDTLVKHFTETLQPVAAWSSSLQRALLFRTGFSLLPGNYRVNATLIALRTHRGKTWTEIIHVPDYRHGFLLSTIALGRPAENVTLSNMPLHPALSAVIPDPEMVFLKGDTLAIAYQVYNAQSGPTGTPDLDVEYKFFVEAQDASRQVGEAISYPHRTGESLGYVVPLDGWPAGNYRVAVGVTDHRAGTTSTLDTRFRIIDGDLSAAPDH